MIPKVSIIVPVYKVENELDRCVYSLINQSLTEIEIILVDDGSPDKCPQMCDEFAKSDSRIKVIHKENGGLSDARNAGLKVATGEYILFVDSDDYIEVNTCKRFIDKVTDKTIEVVTGVANRIEPNEMQTKLNYNHSVSPTILTGIEYMRIRRQKKNLNMASWLNLYKREFIINNNLYFKKGLLHEDEQWTPRVFLLANKVRETNICFYNYIIRDNSITQVQNKTKNALHLIKTAKELELIYNKINDIEFRILMKDYLVMLYLNAFFIGKIHRKEYRNYIDRNFVLKNAKGKKNKAKAILFFISPRLYWQINNFSKKVVK